MKILIAEATSKSSFKPDNSITSQTFDKTTDAEHKSLMDNKSQNIGKNSDVSLHEYHKSGDSSMIGSHLYSKFQASNLSGSLGPYDGTQSRIMSSPTIHERGPESEEESNNDSRLKISQLEAPDIQEKLRFDNVQPKTGTIGDNTGRVSSSMSYMSHLDTGSYNRLRTDNSNPESSAKHDPLDYKQKMKEFIGKRYEKQAANNEIRPSTIFKERLYNRYQKHYNYLVKRNDQDYDELKKLKLLSVYGANKEKEINQMLSNLKVQENAS